MADNKNLIKTCLTLLPLALLAAGCAITPPPVDGRSGPGGDAAHESAAAGAADDAGGAAGPPFDDVWDRIRHGFALPELHSPHVDHYVDFYAARPAFIERLSQRASKYLYHIVEEVEARGLPTEIALLPAIESNYRPRAYSHAHASGLWQFIASTGRRYGLKQNWWYDGRRDVIASTDAALRYLTALHDELNGSWFHALAAYNGGGGRVRRAIERNRISGAPTGYEHLKLRDETARYVPKLIAVKKLIAAPEQYGLTLPPIPNQPYFEVVDTGAQIDLARVAEAAGMSRDELKALNPGFRRWATDPAGPHRLLVPVAAAGRVAAKLDSLPEAQRMRRARHTVSPGDTLIRIARHYGVTTDALRRANGLRGSLIHPGDTLVVPLSGDAAVLAAAGGGGPVVHRVQPGDTLWDIAKRYRVPIKELQEWNEIPASETLHLGQKIMVYAD